MTKFLKFLVKIPLVFFGIYLLFFNAKLFHQPTCRTDSNQNLLNIEVLEQLKFLKSSLQKGADVEMQYLFPEGLMFLNALYGLTWAEVAKDLQKDSELFAKSNQEIEKTLARIQSPRAKSIFPKNTPLKYGAFYQGWSNYLTAKYLANQDLLKFDSTIIQNFKNNCDTIAVAFQNSNSPFLESYHDSSWPADNLVCIASLAVHDQIFESKYAETIQNWLKKVKSHLDENGLIPHSSQARTGNVLQAARGCSQSLMLIFLNEIDAGFAKQQFEIYQKLFVDYRLGLPGIREYPKGIQGKGDVDSGPVIWDIGGAASVVGIRTLKTFGEETGFGIQNSVEAFGMAYQSGEGKKYLFGQLPMLDAFIAWCNAIDCQIDLKETENWCWKFQLLSFLFLAILVYLFWKI